MNRHGPLMHFLARDLPEAPELPPLPEGFRCRTVEPDDLPERVAIHREVWAPSRLTESSFSNVQASWPYRRPSTASSRRPTAASPPTA